MNDFYGINDYSDYEINNEANDESSDDELEPLIDVNNLVDDSKTIEKLEMSSIQIPEEINHSLTPVEAIDEQNKDHRQNKKCSRAEVINELVKIYSNNALITGNDKWIHECKNDTELAIKINDEIEQLIKNKKRVLSRYILNDEHINFFINNHELCETIDDIIDLFYDYFGIYNTYIYIQIIYVLVINIKMIS